MRQRGTRLLLALLNEFFLLPGKDVAHLSKEWDLATKVRSEMDQVVLSVWDSSYYVTNPICSLSACAKAAEAVGECIHLHVSSSVMSVFGFCFYFGFFKFWF